MPAFRFCATKTSEKQTFIFCEKKTDSFGFEHWCTFCTSTFGRAGVVYDSSRAAMC